MNKSFFTSQRDSVLASGSANFAARISDSPASYGLSVPQAEAYAALDAAFQASYLAATTPSTRTKGTVAAKNSARAPLRIMASELTKIIVGTPMVTDAQRINLGIAVRPTRSPVPPPGTPFKFSVALAGDGSLTLTWKCDNPKGSTGTIYQVWRRIAGPVSTGELTYLGVTGKKLFVDSTIPAGAAQITYEIQAVRSTSVGEFAQYTVSFGTNGSRPAVGEPAEQTEETPRLAA
jgi:hypothetical protein